jgi:CubicO group peptidase (beta-lactamase class C family)
MLNSSIGPSAATGKERPDGLRSIYPLRLIAGSLAAALLLSGCSSGGFSDPESGKHNAVAELDTRWERPRGDPVEHAAAGFAKILCSAIFITGRSEADATEEDGYFVSKPEERKLIKSTEVDKQSQTVRVTLPNGIVRTARMFGDQGCVILPRGEDTVHFTPVSVIPNVPDPARTPWPMGDVASSEPLGAEVDAAKIAEAAEAAFSPNEALTAAFVVAHKGRIISERYQEGLGTETKLPSWSMGKSVAATLIGQLVHEGVYDLWKPAPVDEWQKPGDLRAEIRLADILRMSSGLRFIAPQDPDFDPEKGYPDHLYVYTGAIDSFQWAITRPLQWPPNMVGRYRNSDPLTLNYLVKKAALAKGENYLAFPQRQLFDKLGVRGMVIETDPFGNFLLQGYDFAPARDWARFGLLYLQDGVWQGERLLPEGWADFVRTPAPAWDEPRYGGMFWLNRTGAWDIPEDAYYMAGAGGQYTIIIPTHDLVVARLGHYKGADPGKEALNRALRILIEAVPRAREPWQPPTAVAANR